MIILRWNFQGGVGIVSIYNEYDWVADINVNSGEGSLNITKLLTSRGKRFWYNTLRNSDLLLKQETQKNKKQQK